MYVNTNFRSKTRIIKKNIERWMYMNTIIQIWNFVFNCVFSDNGFLVAFGFAALGILTAITAALLFLIPILLLRNFFTWISLYIPDSVSKHYKNRTWVAVAWYILAFFYSVAFFFLVIGLLSRKLGVSAVILFYLAFLFIESFPWFLHD